MGEPLVIPVAHDFICPWCWVGLFQVKRLKEEFGVEIEWLGHELIPEEMEWPEPKPAMPEPANKPPILSRFEFLKVMDGIEVPRIERPKGMRMTYALEAVEFIKEYAPQCVDAFVEDMYWSYWERGERIGDIDVIERLAEPYLFGRPTGTANPLTSPPRHEPSRQDEGEKPLRMALEERRYRDRVIHFDAPSHAAGIFNVPTFTIGGERLAEQPYIVLERAMRKVFGMDEPLSDKAIEIHNPGLRLPDAPAATPYADLSFPPAPKGRPYTYIDMVATIDGKIISGTRDEPVVDLGSEVDHQAMKRIESVSDAVLLGAQTLRAAKKSWNPMAETRIVVTRSGNLPYDSCFFFGRPIIATQARNELGGSEMPAGVEKIRFDDLGGLLRELRHRGVEKLLILGGSTLNAEFFENELVDEIFITIAPKIKLGSDVPTIADGNALPRQSIQNYSIVEQCRIGDEVFVRYRRNS